jgi:hypothetical protein
MAYGGAYGRPEKAYLVYPATFPIGARTLVTVFKTLAEASDADIELSKTKVYTGSRFLLPNTMTASSGTSPEAGLSTSIGRI